MLRLPLIKLNKLVKSLVGDYIDHALMNHEVPFILIWGSTLLNKKGYQIYYSTLYLIDLISIKVIYKPLKIQEHITAIYEYENYTPISYDYKTEDGVLKEDSISIEYFIPEELCYKSNTNLIRLQLLNPYDFYINEVINLHKLKNSLPSPNIKSNVGIESFIKQIKDIKKEITQVLKDKVNEYPFSLIKD